MTGSTARNAMKGADLRVSDAERDAVADELARHLQDGRLDAAEFDERVGRAVTARTQGDLDGLLTDLPPRPAEQPPARRRGGWPLPLAPVMLFVIFIAVAGAAGHDGHAPDGRPGPWAFWWLLWLVPIAIFTARRWLRGRGPLTGR